MKTKPSDSNTLNLARKRQAIIKTLRPLLILIVLIPVVSFMMYPIVNMEPRDIHVGIVNLDRGAHFDQGDVNLGETILDSILNPEEEDDDADGDDAADAANRDAQNADSDPAASPILWETFETQADAQTALDSEKIYAFLIIPADFSEKQTAQLEGFQTLSEALNQMATGTGKLGDAVDTMGSKLGALPEGFQKLAKATDQLGQLADGLGAATNAMGSESQAITDAFGTLQQDQVTLKTSLAQAQAALSALQEKDPAEITEEDIAAVQAALDGAAGVDSTESLTAIAKNAAILSAQAGKVSEGLAGLRKAETGMSENFSTMAKNMSKVGSGTDKMSDAIDGLSEGLGTMSGKLDDQVTDAIDRMNGEEADSDAEEADRTPEETLEDAEEAEPVKLQFIIDQSRHVFVTSTLAGAINGLAAKTGMQVEVEYQNEIPGELNSMYFSMVFVMLTMFASMIPGILTGVTLRPSGTRLRRLRGMAIQVVLAFAIALALGYIIPRAVEWMSGVTLPCEPLSRMVFIASFSLLILTIGAIDLIGLPGAAFPAIIMFCGMAVANFPYEYLPSFWQKYIYPWEPLRFMGEGIRGILYRGGSWWNELSQSLLLAAVLGGLFMVCSLIKKTRTPKAGAGLMGGNSDAVQP